MPCARRPWFIFCFGLVFGSLDIDSNEEADAAARYAADNRKVDAVILRPADVKSAATVTTINVRKLTWNASEPKFFYRELECP